MIVIVSFISSLRNICYHTHPIVVPILIHFQSLSSVCLFARIHSSVLTYPPTSSPTPQVHSQPDAAKSARVRRALDPDASGAWRDIQHSHASAYIARYGALAQTHSVPHA